MEKFKKWSNEHSSVYIILFWLLAFVFVFTGNLLAFISIPVIYFVLSISVFNDKDKSKITHEPIIDKVSFRDVKQYDSMVKMEILDFMHYAQKRKPENIKQIPYDELSKIIDDYISMGCG